MAKAAKSKLSTSEVRARFRSMIGKSGNRSSEKIMLKQKARALSQSISGDSGLEVQAHLRGKPRHRLAEPEMPRILVEARMPKQRDGEGRQLYRSGARGEPERFGEIACKL